MFCQNCGRNNDENALFCENYGKALENIVYKPPGTLAVNRKPVSKLTLVLAVEMIAVILAIYCIITAAGKSFSVENKSEKFFTDMANGDWADAYKQLDVDESQFISSDMFVKANRCNSFGIVKDYSVKTEEKSSLDAKTTVSYRTKGNTNDGSYYISLNRKKAKKYFFFDNWDINAEALIYSDYYILVPADASVSVDGIELGEDYIEPAEEESLIVYKIPQIFKGIHDISVSMEDMEDIEESVQIENDSSRYYLDTMELKQKVIDELINQAGDNMQQIYKAAMEKKKFSTIKGLFTADEESLNDIKSAYEDMVEDMNDGSYHPVRISFKNINAGYSGNSVYMEFDYVMEYTYKSARDGKTEKGKYSGSGELEFQFVKESGSWVQNNIGCHTLFF